jgi:hypothetical protein
MSHREVMIVLSHALACSPCRERLLTKPNSVFSGRALTAEEKEALAKLQAGDFVTTELLARAAGTSTDELSSYRDHPVARLRHF